MFSVPGIVALMTFIVVRPHDICPALVRVPFLYLFCALLLFGLAVDLKLRLVKPIATPQLVWALLVLFWILISIALLTPPETAPLKVIFIAVSFLLFFGISQGIQSFKTLQILTATLVVLTLFLIGIAVHQGLTPLTCVMIDDRDSENFIPDGRPCAQRGGVLRPGTPSRAPSTCASTSLVCSGPLRSPSGSAGAASSAIPTLAMMIACGLALLFGFAFRRFTPPVIAITLVVGALALLALVKTQSRGGQLVFLAALGVYFVRRFGLRGLASPRSSPSPS